MRSPTVGSAIGILIALAMALPACGPEPGTPEYVLAKVREGRVVGGQNLKLLTEAQLGEMTALLEDKSALPIARLQVLERLFQLELDDGLERLGPLIDDPDPEVRLRIVQWLSVRSDIAAARLLVERIAVEQELVVSGNAVNALGRIGRGIADPDPELVESMISRLHNPADKQRRLWATALGGWHGERVEAALIKTIDDEDPAVRKAAAHSLAGPVVRALERVAPLYVSMLGHRHPEVRSAGVAGLSACSFPRRVPIKGAKCAERPTLSLLEVVPELPEALTAFRARTDLPTQDRRLASDLAACVETHFGGDAGAPAPPSPER
jgi:HEAT repeat protein